jgi:hypothetical protein
MGDLIRRAGGPAVAAAALPQERVPPVPMPRRIPTRSRRGAGKCSPTPTRLAHRFRTGREPSPLISSAQVARLSWSDEGPRLAKEFLGKHGIALVVVRRLPRTYLDGAALKLGDGTPVVGLALRYDRVDSFWFCLLHELPHLGCHMGRDDDVAFVDDLTLREVEGGRREPKEAEADQWAEEALVPLAIWETSEARRNPTPMAVVSLSKAVQVHPAIVAGKIRRCRARVAVAPRQPANQRKSLRCGPRSRGSRLATGGG